MAKANHQFGVVHSSAYMARVNGKGADIAPFFSGMVRGGSDTHRSLDAATTAFSEMCAEAHAGGGPGKWTWSSDDRVSLVTRRGKVLAEMIPLRG